MLRAAWRTLSAVRIRAVTPAPGFRLPSGGSAGLPLDQRGLQPRRLLLQAARGLASQKPVQPIQDNDLPPSTLLKDYQNIPGIDKVDDVVKRLLSLEMANRKEKLKAIQEQLMNKVVANPKDTSSLEARRKDNPKPSEVLQSEYFGICRELYKNIVVALTVKICNYEEHMQKHRKDKAHKRYLLMSIDQRKKMLKNLRKTNYEVFEKTCRELGIEYTFPPLYYRRAHRRFLAKKALCIQVFQEVQKLKKQKRALKAAAAAQKQGSTENPASPPTALPETRQETRQEGQ